jgi:hypothetical protein
MDRIGSAVIRLELQNQYLSSKAILLPKMNFRENRSSPSMEDYHYQRLLAKYLHHFDIPSLAEKYSGVALLLCLLFTVSLSFTVVLHYVVWTSLRVYRSTSQSGLGLHSSHLYSLFHGPVREHPVMPL